MTGIKTYVRTSRVQAIQFMYNASSIASLQELCSGFKVEVSCQRHPNAIPTAKILVEGKLGKVVNVYAGDFVIRCNGDITVMPPQAFHQQYKEHQ